MKSGATIADRPLADCKFVLATDLDGTFLGGSEEARLRLYRWIERERDKVGLIFVTGRDPEFIADLCDGTEVPWPEYVVGDVGTTIALTFPHLAEERIRPIEELEREISELWGDRAAAVHEALEGHPGLTLQPTGFRYRVSYDMDPKTYCASAEEKIAAMGLDPLLSADRFFDVLPPGVSKGPSLRRLIHHLGVPEERVLVAGDTLNDLSMLVCGLNAVAVGGSEPALVERVRNNEKVHLARAAGAAGILEAIEHFDLISIPQGATDAL